MTITPPAIVNRHDDIGTTRITVCWTWERGDGQEVAAFQARFRPAALPDWSPLPEVGRGGRCLTITDLEPGTLYTIEVRAITGGATEVSAWDRLSVKTKDEPDPAGCIDPPHSLTTTATRDSVKVCWEHTADGCDPAAGFDVSWISGNGEGGGVSVVGTDGGCHTIGPLEPGVCVAVNVIAVSARDNDRRSNPAKVKACTTSGRVVPPVLDTECGGCRPWPVDPDCCSGWPGEEENDPVLLARAKAAVRIASDRMRKLTAGRWGLCEEVVRPCRDVCRVAWDDSWGRYLNPPFYGHGGGILRPYLENGRMFNACRGGCAEDCSCDAVCRVALPGPVHEVLAVYLNGEILDRSAYILTEAPDNWLVRVDGGCWPECQNMTSSLTEPDTFAVHYLKGRDPACDPDAIRAVSALACELFKKACGNKCRLPGRIRSLTRDGVTYEVMEGWPRFGTGLDEVDDWLALVNPRGQRAPTAVFTLDLPMPRFHGRGGAW